MTSRNQTDETAQIPDHVNELCKLGDYMSLHLDELVVVILLAAKHLAIQEPVSVALLEVLRHRPVAELLDVQIVHVLERAILSHDGDEQRHRS